MIYLLITKTSCSTEQDWIDIEGLLCDENKQLVLLNDNRGIILEGKLSFNNEVELGDFIEIGRDWKLKGESPTTFDAHDPR